MRPFQGGLPPGPGAGAISARTKALRPAVVLSEEECAAARRLRRRGRNVGEIAAQLSAPEGEVRQALAAMRTRRRVATRRSLNVTTAAHTFVADEMQPGEAIWKTVDRLLVELTIRRALAGALVVRRGSD